MSQPLVSVIIPAYNAASFIAKTIASARRQIYDNLEILIVDDGSIDTTAHIAEAAAREDNRVRCIRQTNRGVAVARNRAIEGARGTYIAPLDADDVWHPDYLRLQVEALERSGPAAALSYAWYILIDEAGQVVRLGRSSRVQSALDALAKLIAFNFVGNGSSTVMRRASVLAVGGYDTTLRQRGAEGSEDRALYIALARRWDFAVVPRYLVGYRQHAAAMSVDRDRIHRSGDMVLLDLRTQRPDLPARWFRSAEARRHAAAFGRSFLEREYTEAVACVARAGKSSLYCLPCAFGYWLPVLLLEERACKRFGPSEVGWIVASGVACSA
jgi:glycosyltransferase involved in cell wall biosynthesis